MKLLVDPIYTSYRMSKCATYFALKNTALDFLNRDESNFVYCLVPDENNPNNKFVCDDIVKHERWLNIPVFFGGDRYQNMFFPPDELKKIMSFNEYWDWDYLLTTRNNGMFWKFGPLKNDKNTLKKFIALVEPFPLLSFKKTIVFSKIQNFNILNSYFGFDRIYIQTEWERDEILKLARLFLSPYMRAELMKKMVVTFPKPNIDYDYPFKKKPDYDSPLNLLYVQRLDTFERRFDEMLEILRKTFILSGDNNVNFRICTNSGKDVGSDDVGFLDLGRLPREEFYNELKKSDVYVSWSIDEGMPYSLLEATSFGVIPIVKREKWSEDFFGKNYWGLVDKKEEAIAKIFYIQKNRKKAYQDYLEWYKNDFKPRIEERGNQYQVLNEDIKRHNEYLKNKVDKKIYKNDKLFGIIDKELDEVNLNNIDEIRKLDGVRMNKVNEINENIPMNRLKDFYFDRLNLIFGRGWIDKFQPGRLIRE